MAGNKQEKIWADAVKRAVHRRLDDVEGKPRKLEHLADKLVGRALDGEVSALKEIGDRLDGRSTQQIDGTMVHGMSEELLSIISGAVHGRSDT